MCREGIVFIPLLWHKLLGSWTWLCKYVISQWRACCLGPPGAADHSIIIDTNKGLDIPVCDPLLVNPNLLFAYPSLCVLPIAWPLPAFWPCAFPALSAPSHGLSFIKRITVHASDYKPQCMTGDSWHCGEMATGALTVNTTNCRSHFGEPTVKVHAFQVGRNGIPDQVCYSKATIRA